MYIYMLRNKASVTLNMYYNLMYRCNLVTKHLYMYVGV